MKYVALLSGGKDSCFNLLHCSQNGHELVAAASLGPEHGREELDSYLYQTVGQDAIEYVACALEVPLYRKVISGKAVEQGSQYGSRSDIDVGVHGDETEDLYGLLSTVMSHHPDVQGVAVGAILSNYQRVRVEHVCRRLRLTPLCYLWQRDQNELLSEMIEAGMEAIVIKVAGIGLTVSHLGNTIAEMQPMLLKLHKLYGSHICGEGGEYETLTLDCPLFKHRLVIDEAETIMHSDNDLAPVAYLRIHRVTLTQKSASVPCAAPIPPLLDPRFAVICNPIQDSPNLVGTTQYSTASPSHQTDMWLQRTRSKRVGSWVAIANVQRQGSENVSIEEEVKECFSELQRALKEHSLDLSHCSHINVFLSSMDFFHSVNAVYFTYFGTSPPSRACVAVGLPIPIRVKLDCIAYDTPSGRQTLHVQGLSYWAPANIGPYSQAIVVDNQAFISGQIGLIPSNLTLPSPRSLSLEAALSFQHVKRVVDALRDNDHGSWQDTVGHTQSALYWLVDGADLPTIKWICQKHENPCIPSLFLLVKSLPKNALLEKQVTVHTGSYWAPDDYDEPVLQRAKPIFEQDKLVVDDLLVSWEVSKFEEISARCTIVCFRGNVVGDHKHPALNDLLKRFGEHCLSVRLFYRPSQTITVPPDFADLLGPGSCHPVTSVPCRLISSRHHDDWDYALCIIGM